MRTTSVARRYAQATFEVARQNGDPRSWLQDLDRLADALRDRDLLAALRSPNFSSDQKLRVLKDLAPNLSPELINLLRLLIQRHRIEILPGIAAAFAQYLDELEGRVEADVLSARALSEDEVRSIQEQLSQRTGRTVRVRRAVDPKLLGGLVIRLGDELIDASVATRLERLRQRLA